MVVFEHGRGRVPTRAPAGSPPAPPPVPHELVEALARAVALRRVYWLGRKRVVHDPHTRAEYRTR